MTDSQLRERVRATSLVCGSNLARIRSERGWSTRALAARAEEYGLKLAHTGILDLESGKRSMSVDQLTALSAALGVSPSTLLMPHSVTPDAEVTVTGAKSAASSMWGWLRATTLPSASTTEGLDSHEREAVRRASTPKWAW